MNVDRRNFLNFMVRGVAVAAAVRTFPFRVYSFPSEIVRPQLTHAEAVLKHLTLTRPELLYPQQEIIFTNGAALHVDSEVMRIVSFVGGKVVVERGRNDYRVRESWKIS